MRLQVALGSPLEAEPVDALVRVVAGRLIPRGDPVLQQAGPAVPAALAGARRTAGRSLAPATAVTTGAGLLPATWLIHVQVPRFEIRTDNSHLLARAYREVLRHADAVLATTIAMPALGTTGVFWPLNEATAVAMRSLRGAVTNVRQVTLYVPAAAALERFAEALARR